MAIKVTKQEKVLVDIDKRFDILGIEERFPKGIGPEGRLEEDDEKAS
ncbi:MAG: hypothetical protein VB085_09175 [Peptococcaceae bacterium]|nr:hypothetical protein [Peptococcaceae bacterium]